jgi:single-stranded-DNA-specific exonuclease
MNSPLKKQWIVDSDSKSIPIQIQDELIEFPMLLRQLLFNRGIVTAKDATTYLFKKGPLFDPFQLLNMDIAVERIFKAIDWQEPIVVYGDYDVDGVTATALMVECLQGLDANVRAYIPNRFDEGYGLNLEALRSLWEEGARLVITVDCGVRSPKEIEFAKELGMDMIISDHHEPGKDLPKAFAVINPKQVGDAYPFRDLAGVGVAFKIAQALLSKRPAADLHLDDLLDLVAVGTVADIVPLTHENRSLVKAGLDILAMGKRPGLWSLAQVAGVNIERVSAENIGFLIGPRLNAAGRLDTAELAYKLLVSRDILEAGFLAQQLDDLNKERQDQTRAIQEESEKRALTTGNEFLIFAADETFNEGVVGLAASRLAESYFRPAVVAHTGEEETRASCRSIPAFHITRALDQCAELLVRHGGHSMAAGFTVRNQNLEELVIKLRMIAEEQLSGQMLRPELHADMELPLQNPKEIFDAMALIEPTGEKNPGVKFVSRGLWVKKFSAVGKDKNHLKLQVSDGHTVFDAIAFRMGHWAENMPSRIDLLYSYDINHFNGRTTVQLMVRDIKAYDQELND